MRRLIGGVAMLAMLAPATPVRAAVAEYRIAVYFGASQTKPSDLHVVQRARGNDATFHGVRWLAFPFRFSIYYGLRFIYTLPSNPTTRIALDFTHYKVYAQTQDAVAQIGTWHGAALRATGPMLDRVQSFEITHGVNMFGLSVMQQLSSSQNGGYIGVGPVTYIPHSENRIDGVPGGDGYELGAGFGFQGVVGAQTCAGDRRVFAEGKYDTGGVRVTVAGGDAQTALHTVHELVGMQLGPCSGP